MSVVPARWRRFAPAGLAAVGGLLAAAAHPPYGLLPGVFGYALILWALEQGRTSAKPLRVGFLIGWAAGAGYLLLCTTWIVEPFLIDVAEHGWQAPFAVALCAAGIGILWGGAGWLYALALGRAAPPVWARLVSFVGALALWEWLRGHMLTGFPWDLVGETFTAGSPLSQGASVIGAYGLGLVVLFIGAAPVALTLGASRREQLALMACACALVGGLGGWGRWRLEHPSRLPGPTPTVRIVQPNLPEPPAWSPEVLELALTRYTTMTAQPSAEPPAQLVVWPEGAIPASFNQLLAPGSTSAERIRAALQPGQILLAGGVRVEADPSGREPEGLYFNTLLALRREAEGLRLLGVYDKHHLVPFGEYMPFAQLLAPLGLRKLVSVSADFTPGPFPRPLPLPGLLVQPLICYEALFPGLAGGRGGERPSLLVNVSDDAWFGRHAGPKQHLNIASYRAIEEGLPMLRATPTGVSAVIDPQGRTLRRLEPSVVGVIDAKAPPAAPRPFYAAARDMPFWTMVAIALATGLIAARRQRKVAF